MYSQGAKSKDTNQRDLPPCSHIQIPNRFDWYHKNDDIYQDIDACTHQTCNCEIKAWVWQLFAWWGEFAHEEDEAEVDYGVDKIEHNDDPACDLDMSDCIEYSEIEEENREFDGINPLGIYAEQPRRLLFTFLETISAHLGAGY